MAQSIRIKRSSIPGKSPSVGDLSLGELAVNTYDGKLYTKKNDGTESVVEIGAGAGGGTGSVESLDDLSDVTLASPLAGQVLKYNGSAWVNAADATGTGGLSGITVGTYGGPDGNADVGSAVTALRFAAGSGFSVTEGPDGATEARVSLNSTFKTWHVAGSDDLVAEGEDEVTFEAVGGISLFTYLSPMGEKKLYIGGFSGTYSDLTGKPDLTTKADLVNGKLSTSQLPNLAISEFLGDVANQTAMLAKTGERGDWVVRTDTSEAYMLVADGGSLLAHWRKIATPVDAVTSVSGKTGAVTLAKGDVGLGNVDNTSDANKPISAATQTALDQKAPLASPAFTGAPTAPTAAVDISSTQLATTAYVVNQGYLKSSTASSTYALISQIASTATQLEAESGVNNTRMMTPLRVAQAIAALGGAGGGGGGSSGPTYTDQMFLVSAGVF